MRRLGTAFCGLPAIWRLTKRKKMAAMKHIAMSSRPLVPPPMRKNAAVPPRMRPTERPTSRKRKTRALRMAFSLRAWNAARPCPPGWTSMRGRFWSFGFGWTRTSSRWAGGRICAMALAIIDLPVPGSPSSSRWRRWRAAFLATSTASSWPMTSSIRSSGRGRSEVLPRRSCWTHWCGSLTESVWPLRPSAGASCGGTALRRLGASMGVTLPLALRAAEAQGLLLGRQEVGHHGQGGGADGGADEGRVGARRRQRGRDGRRGQGGRRGEEGAGRGPGRAAHDGAVLDDAVVAVGEVDALLVRLRVAVVLHAVLQVVGDAGGVADQVVVEGVAGDAELQVVGVLRAVGALREGGEDLVVLDGLRRVAVERGRVGVGRLAVDDDALQVGEEQGVAVLAQGHGGDARLAGAVADGQAVQVGADVLHAVPVPAVPAEGDLRVDGGLVLPLDAGHGHVAVGARRHAGVAADEAGVLLEVGLAGLGVDAPDVDVADLGAAAGVVAGVGDAGDVGLAVPRHRVGGLHAGADELVVLEAGPVVLAAGVGPRRVDPGGLAGGGVAPIERLLEPHRHDAVVGARALRGGVAAGVVADVARAGGRGGVAGLVAEVGLVVERRVVDRLGQRDEVDLLDGVAGGAVGVGLRRLVGRDGVAAVLLLVELDDVVEVAAAQALRPQGADVQVAVVVHDAGDVLAEAVGAPRVVVPGAAAVLAGERRVRVAGQALHAVGAGVAAARRGALRRAAAVQREERHRVGVLPVDGDLRRAQEVGVVDDAVRAGGADRHRVGAVGDGGAAVEGGAPEAQVALVG